jgi:nucleoside-diphosphate-sugar epimerase
MKVLITGAGGFLGQFFYHDSEFNLLDTIYGTTSMLEGSKYLKFSSLYNNVSDILKDLKIDAIIHLAAAIPSTFESADFELFQQNTVMMNNILNLALEKKVSKVIYLSTFGSMINPAKYDIKDSYTLSKITGEHFCSILESKGIQTLSLRLPSPYGEYNLRNNVVQIFSDLALLNKPINVFGNGKRAQNFIYAGDVVGCVRKCLGLNISGVYGLTNLKNTSMLELAKLIIGISGSSSEIILGNHQDPLENAVTTDFSQTKSVSEFGYQLQYTFESGLERYLSWRKGMLK